VVSSVSILNTLSDTGCLDAQQNTMFTSLPVIEQRLVYTNLATGCPQWLWDSALL